MSFGVDVNILLYASDTNCARHPKAGAFVEGCARGSETFCLAWVTLMSYLRMATHPAIFAKPLTHAQALSNVESLLATPMCQVLNEEEGFLDIYRRLTSGVSTRGNLCRTRISPPYCSSAAWGASTRTTATSAGSPPCG